MSRVMVFSNVAAQIGCVISGQKDSDDDEVNTNRSMALIADASRINSNS